MNTQPMISYITNQGSTTLNVNTQLGISDQFGNSSYGGFDGHCLIGVSHLYFAGNNGAIMNRSAIFDIKAKPFSNV